MDFGKQPKPVTITITGDDGRDIFEAGQKLGRWLSNQWDVVDSKLTPEGYIFRCYPRAVND